LALDGGGGDRADEPQRCVFRRTSLPDGCMHACIAYLDPRSWFVFGRVSRFAREWCARPAQVAVATRTVLASAARVALAAELAELGVAEPKAAAVELSRALQKTGGGVWSGGSLALGLCGGLGAFSARQRKAWAGRDLDFFVPWSAAFEGQRLCPVAEFFERVCPRTPLRDWNDYATGPGPDTWRNMCRYMTRPADVERARLHDPHGAYFLPSDHAAAMNRVWVHRAVLETPVRRAEDESSEDGSVGDSRRDGGDLKNGGEDGGGGGGGGGYQESDDAGADARERALYADESLDVKCEWTSPSGTNKRGWRWAALDENGYRVPFICARRLYRFPTASELAKQPSGRSSPTGEAALRAAQNDAWAGPRSVDIVYVDLDEMRRVLGGVGSSDELVARYCAGHRQSFARADDDDDKDAKRPDERALATLTAASIALSSPVGLLRPLGRCAQKAASLTRRPSLSLSPRLLPRCDMATWCALSCDASILRSAYDGARLVACAYACLRARSFELWHDAPILELVPCDVAAPYRRHEQIDSRACVWGVHGAQTDHAAGGPSHVVDLRRADRPPAVRRKKYEARGFTSRGSVVQSRCAAVVSSDFKVDV
jgi:hypothetical protein